MTRLSLTKTIERYLRTDLSYLTKNGSWLVGGQVFIALAGFLLSIAFANLLPQQEYGVYKFIISVGGMLAAFRLSGLRLAVTQAVARGAIGTTRTAMRVGGRWSLLVVGLAILVAGYYASQDNWLLATGIFIIGIHKAALSTLRIYRGYRLGQEQFKTVTIEDVLSTGGSIIALLITLSLTDNVLLLLLAGTVPVLLVTTWFAWRTMRSIPAASQRSQSAISFGKHVSAQNMLMAVATHIDKVILFQWVGSAQLAIFALAALVPDQIGGVVKNVITLVVPRFATKDTRTLRDSVRQKLWRIVLITAGLAGLYALIAPTLFQLVFPQYLSSIWYSQLLVLGLPMVPVINLLLSYFDAREATATLYKTKIISNLLKILITLGAIWWFGILGAVLAQIIGRYLSAGILGWYYWRDRVAA